MIELNHLRQLLWHQVVHAQPLSYQAVAQQLALKPPRTILQLSTALERMMLEDCLAERPQLAAMVIQKNAPLPRPGFFQTLSQLGLYQGNDQGNQAEIWHLRELERLQAYYRQQHI